MIISFNKQNSVGVENALLELHPTPRVYWFPAYKHQIKPITREPGLFWMSPCKLLFRGQQDNKDMIIPKKEIISIWKGFQNAYGYVTSRVCEYWKILFHFDEILSQWWLNVTEVSSKATKAFLTFAKLLIKYWRFHNRTFWIKLFRVNILRPFPHFKVWDDK